jgi:UDP-N-acetylglucosamine 2-epimerase
MTMPEEINRKLTDHCSSLLFAPTQTAVNNLRDEGFRQQVRLTGDTMVDALHAVMPIVEKRQNTTLDASNVTRNNFVLVTLHRPSNVDDPGRLGQIHFALSKIAEKLPVIFLAHPRTRSRLAQLGILNRSKGSGVNYLNPQGYLTSLALLKNASCLLTDSGGMQKEAFLLRVPCITVRQNTEWPETLRGKANRLIADPRRLVEAVTSVASDKALRTRICTLGNPFGDGHAAVRIARIVETHLHRRTTRE